MRLCAWLIVNHCDPTGIGPPRAPLKTMSFLESIIEAVDDDETIGVAQLLNTVIHNSFGRRRAIRPPEWLLGEWLSIKGWDEGEVFKCTKNRHWTTSLYYREKAIGSFSSALSVGVVTDIKRLDAHTCFLVGLRRMAHPWTDPCPLSDGEYGRSDTNYSRLKGIWWYGSAGIEVYGRGTPPASLPLTTELKKLSVRTTMPGS